MKDQGRAGRLNVGNNGADDDDMVAAIVDGVAAAFKGRRAVRQDGNIVVPGREGEAGKFVGAGTRKATREFFLINRQDIDGKRCRVLEGHAAQRRFRKAPAAHPSLIHQDVRSVLLSLQQVGRLQIWRSLQ